MKVALIIEVKKYEDLVVPDVDLSTTWIHDDCNVRSVRVLKDTYHYEVIIRVPSKSVNSSNSIAKYYIKWMDRRDKLNELILSNNEIALNKFRKMMSDNQSVRIIPTKYICSSNSLSSSPIDQYWLDWRNQNGWHKPLDKLERGDVVSIRVIN